MNRPPRSPDFDDARREALDRVAPARPPARFVAPSREASGNAPSAEDIRARARAHEARHPPRPAPEAPDPGKVLVSIPRPDGTELRVSVHRYQGRDFVRVAPWSRGQGEAWWPAKGKGVTVKVRELGRVAAALADAMDATDDGDGR